MTQIPVEYIQRNLDHQEANLIEDLKRVRNMAERLVGELNRRIKDLAECQPAEKVERYSWAVNDIENFSRNVNSSTMVRRAAEYEGVRNWLRTMVEYEDLRLQ